MPKKYIKELNNIFLWTCPTDPWYNMLQTLERRKKYIGDILSDERTPPPLCSVCVKHKRLSVRLRTKWLWVRIPLLSLFL